MQPMYVIKELHEGYLGTYVTMHVIVYPYICNYI